MHVELQNDLDDILSLHLDEFFDYVRSIRYGYKDQNNDLHFLTDEDFKKYEYSFSTPGQIIHNDCGWILVNLLNYIVEKMELHANHFS